MILDLPPVPKEKEQKQPTKQERKRKHRQRKMKELVFSTRIGYKRYIFKKR